MRSALVRLFSAYEAAHRHPWTRRTHALAIPLIAFSAVAISDWLSLLTLPGGWRFSLAHPGMFLAGLWALWMSPALGALFSLGLLVCLALGWVTPWWFVVGAGGAGWIVQLMGHVVFEKNRPAFLENLLQVLVGPLFFLAELTGAWPLPRRD